MFMEQALNNIIRILKFFIKILFKERKRDKSEVYKERYSTTNVYFFFIEKGYWRKFEKKFRVRQKGCLIVSPGKFVW